MSSFLLHPCHPCLRSLYSSHKPSTYHLHPLATPLCPSNQSEQCPFHTHTWLCPCQYWLSVCPCPFLHPHATPATVHPSVHWHLVSQLANFYILPIQAQSFLVQKELYYYKDRWHLEWHSCYSDTILSLYAGGPVYTVLVRRMPHRKWRASKQQLNCWPDFALLGCSLISLHFLWGILHTRRIYEYRMVTIYTRYGYVACFHCGHE